MRKLLLSTALLSSIALAAPAAEAKTASASVDAPQIRVQIGRHRGRDRYWNRTRRTRTVVTTRIAGRGRYRVRETIRTTYLPNGRVIRTVIRRQPIRG